MSQHLHFYSAQGRGTSSIPLAEYGIHPSVGTGLSVRIQYALMSAGYSLKRWLEDDQAGIAVAHGIKYIVRVKSDGTVRDMRPTGAAQTLADVRRDGVDVDPLTGLPV